jgi:uncharacterized membrane protein YsdA (DUF1294 family)
MQSCGFHVSLAGLLLTAGAAAALRSLTGGLWLWCYLVAVNAVTFLFYAWDKRAAVSAGRRVPEVSLLVMGLLGGSAGGLLARHLLRHKTVKVRFRRAFWGIVVLQIAALGLWMILRSRS